MKLEDDYERLAWFWYKVVSVEYAFDLVPFVTSRDDMVDEAYVMERI